LLEILIVLWLTLEQFLELLRWIPFKHIFPQLLHLLGILIGKILFPLIFTGLTIGPNLGMKLIVGSSYRDIVNTGPVYRATAVDTLQAYLSPAVAASWNRNWENSVTIDITGLTIGPVLGLYSAVQLVPGLAYQSVTNDPTGAFRATDVNTLRWYPNLDIAVSWDPNWGYHLSTIDFSGLTIGPPMELKKAVVLVPGSAYHSVTNDPAGVFRATDPNTLRRYPSVEIAVSWDTKWGNHIGIDFYGLKLRSPMEMQQSVPTSTSTTRPKTTTTTLKTTTTTRPKTTTTTLKTTTTTTRPKTTTTTLPKIVLDVGKSYSSLAYPGEIYRSTAKNTLQKYPNDAIASSWDLNWRNGVVIDFSGVIIGPDMRYKLVVGHAYHSVTDPALAALIRRGLTSLDFLDLGIGSVLIYRASEVDTLRLYPTDAIASSWDPNWRNHIGIDTTGLKFGPDMEMNSGAPPTMILEVGKSYSSPAYPGEVFLATAVDTLQKYPTDEIASSWDPNWRNSYVIDFNGLTIGADLEMHVFVLDIGKPYTCLNDASHAVYRATAVNVLRRYPTEEIAASWDSDWSCHTAVDCTDLIIGADLSKLLTTPLDVGHAYTCLSDPATVFRATDVNVLQRYSCDEIAHSWDPSWTSHTAVNCTGMIMGPVLKKLLTTPLVVGNPYTCISDPINVFRATATNVLQRYLSHEVAYSWDLNWFNNNPVDCTNLTIGATLTAAPINRYNLI
jgi:hypothetical protein